MRKQPITRATSSNLGHLTFVATVAGAIQHATDLARESNGVITVLRDRDTFDFGAAWVDSKMAVCNVLPPRYFDSCMARYRAEMPSYMIVDRAFLEATNPERGVSA